MALCRGTSPQLRVCVFDWLLAGRLRQIATSVPIERGPSDTYVLVLLTIRSCSTRCSKAHVIKCSEHRLYWNICQVSYVIGYARTSTVDQIAGFEAQKRELIAAGCRRIFEEQVSSLAQRTQLEAAIAYLREGDVLVVTSLDRLARSMRDLISLVDRINAIGASLRILNMNLDTSNATSELILNVIGSVAQWERVRMLERQAEGIAMAKAKGKYKGRAPTARRKADQVRTLNAQGLGMTAIARQLGIGRTSVYRILNSAS